MNARKHLHEEVMPWIYACPMGILSTKSPVHSLNSETSPGYKEAKSICPCLALGQMLFFVELLLLNGNRQNPLLSNRFWRLCDYNNDHDSLSPHCLSNSSCRLFLSIEEWTYVLRVIDASVWPSSSLNVFTSTPASMHRVANVCLKAW